MFIMYSSKEPKESVGVARILKASVKDIEDVEMLCRPTAPVIYNDF